jgi:hypothetical protein
MHGLPQSRGREMGNGVGPQMYPGFFRVIAPRHNRIRSFEPYGPEGLEHTSTDIRLGERGTDRCPSVAYKLLERLKR